MDGDLEDGELSGSCSDSEMAAARPKVPPAFGGQFLRSRAAAETPAAGYRSAVQPLESSGSDSSDEEEASLRRKRQKVSNRPSATPRNRPGGRRVNNIWGSVVQEQRQDAIAAELGIFGMEGEVSMASRDVETYNYVLARKIMEKEREQDKEEASVLDEQLEEYMKGRDPEERLAGSKRKRSAKERLGPRAEMDVQGRYQITEEDPEDTVVDEIAYRLQEPKKDLIQRVVRVLGAKKAIELLGETATLEGCGGVFTLDGSRRRTPGGVYLNLLKNTPSISKAQVRKIFLDEQQKEGKNKKAAQKRKRHLLAKKMKEAIGTLDLQEHDDVSRETFASDTNDALESLEEDDGPGESVGGLEETAVVYNTTDLEVF